LTLAAVWPTLGSKRNGTLKPLGSCCGVEEGAGGLLGIELPFTLQANAAALFPNERLSNSSMYADARQMIDPQRSTTDPNGKSHAEGCSFRLSSR
jgi:hypothetical protein